MSDIGDNDSPDVEPPTPAEPAELSVPDPPPPTETGAVAPSQAWSAPAPVPGRVQLTDAEGIWYVILCIYFGAGYLAKVPVKKALSEVGLVEMTSGEKTWYFILCLWFGVGYFAKVPTKRALGDAGRTQLTGAEKFWYFLECLYFGAGYIAKVPTKKAFSEVGLVAMTEAERSGISCCASGSAPVTSTRCPPRKHSASCRRSGYAGVGTASDDASTESSFGATTTCSSSTRISTPPINSSTVPTRNASA
jgi:hypothetical protein